jgi:hypothetical protein
MDGDVPRWSIGATQALQNCDDRRRIVGGADRHRRPRAHRRVRRELDRIARPQSVRRPREARLGLYRGEYVAVLVFTVLRGPGIQAAPVYDARVAVVRAHRHDRGKDRRNGVGHHALRDLHGVRTPERVVLRALRPPGKVCRVDEKDAQAQKRDATRSTGAGTPSMVSRYRWGCAISRLREPPDLRLRVRRQGRPVKGRRIVKVDVVSMIAVPFLLLVPVVGGPRLVEAVPNECWELRPPFEEWWLGACAMLPHGLEAAEVSSCQGIQEEDLVEKLIGGAVLDSAHAVHTNNRTHLFGYDGLGKAFQAKCGLHAFGWCQASDAGRHGGRAVYVGCGGMCGVVWRRVLDGGRGGAVLFLYDAVWYDFLSSSRPA